MDPFVVVDEALDGLAVGADVAIPAEATRHLRKVLRHGDGGAVVVSDGRGRTAAAVLVPDGARLTAEVVVADAPRPRLHVLQGLAKGRKVDDVIRTLTELGADRVTPIAAERSVVRLTGDKATKATERWRAVARAATEQARRPHALQVDPPRTVDEVAEALGAEPGARLVVAHVGAGRALAQGLEELPATAASLVLAVGPEGGWTDAEVDRFTAVGGLTVSLGRSVLRTEHAAPALAAIASFTLGRMV